MDGEIEQRIHLGELGRVGLDVVVLEVRFVERKTDADVALPVLVVAVETEVRIEVPPADDQGLLLVLLGDPVVPRSAARVGPHDQEREEVRPHEGEDAEQHERAEDDLLIEVSGDLEWIRRHRDRRDVVRRRLLDRFPRPVVLANELDTLDRLLGGLDLVLVLDEETEEGDQPPEQHEADDPEDDIGVDGHAVISITEGSHSFFWRSMTLSGFVSTTSVPP